MNKKFFTLPKERQQSILNAGYQVFSRNSYKKSPVGEIAAIAGISKSLLFYYFRNKQDLYLFLWENCLRITSQYMNASGCYSKQDLFEMIYCGMQAKMHLLYQYPDLGAFAIQAFYEKDPDVCPAIHASYEQYKNTDAKDALENLDPSQFIEGIDIRMMYREMYLAAEGYLWEMLHKEELDYNKMEQDLLELTAFWKKIYSRKK